MVNVKNAVVGLATSLLVVSIVGCGKNPLAPGSEATNSTVSATGSTTGSTDGAAPGSTPTPPATGSSSDTGSSGSSSSGSGSTGSSTSSPLPVALPNVAGSAGVVTGICPNLVLMVGGRVVLTTPSTVFNGAPCSAFHIGDIVSAQGNVQADGALIAQEITK